MRYMVRITDTLNPEAPPTRLPFTFLTRAEAQRVAADQDERQLNPGRFVYEVMQDDAAVEEA